MPHISSLGKENTKEVSCFGMGLWTENTLQHNATRTQLHLSIWKGIYIALIT